MHVRRLEALIRDLLGRLAKVDEGLACLPERYFDGWERFDSWESRLMLISINPTAGRVRGSTQEMYSGYHPIAGDILKFLFPHPA